MYGHNYLGGKMFYKKKGLLLSLLAVGALLLAACSPATESTSADSTDSADSTESATSDPGEEILNIWYVNVLPSYPAWGRSMEQFEADAESLGYKATAVGPPKVDGVAMIGMMEQAIADGADGLIICNIDPAAFETTITKAQDAGIIVVTIGCVDEMSDYSIGTDNTAFGVNAADVIAADVGEDAQVLIIATDQTTPNQVAQVEGFKARIAEAYPGMGIVAWEGDNGDPAIAAQKITANLAANARMSAIWMVAGGGMAGVEPGLKEAGKSPGDIYALGIDDVEATILAIQDGWLSGSLNQCFFDSTPLAVALIRAKLKGEGPSQRFWPVNTDVVAADKLPYGGCPSDATPTL